MNSALKFARSVRRLAERSGWLTELRQGVLRRQGRLPAVVLDSNGLPVISARKQFAFISGCGGDSYRYRCEHHAEALRGIGYAVDIFPPNHFPYRRLLADYGIIVAHRVSWSGKFDKLIRRANSIGALVVYDIDDLIFDTRRIGQIDAYNQMSAAKQERLRERFTRCSRAMSLTNAVTVSTDKLLRELQLLYPGKPAAIARNKASQAMCRLAEASLSRARQVSDAVTIGYFSGTPTHDKDFTVCVPALRRILQEHRNTRLMIVGHLDIPAPLAPLASRINKIPFVPWQQCAELYREVDINLAPLEYGNDFTESKSELKFLEAALLGVPTVASDLGAYRKVIASWKTGALCAEGEEWYRAIGMLVLDSELRCRIGQAARAVAMRNTTQTSGGDVRRLWRDLITSALERSPVPPPGSRPKNAHPP
jgi:glycosyltransferase involved in cell wall biosynthesis